MRRLNALAGPAAEAAARSYMNAYAERTSSTSLDDLQVLGLLKEWGMKLINEVFGVDPALSLAEPTTVPTATAAPHAMDATALNELGGDSRIPSRESVKGGARLPAHAQPPAR